MEWNNINGWLEYESIEHPLVEYYTPREYFDDYGNWMDTADSGYDFKCLEDVGYIYFWSNNSGDKEYVLRVPRARFNDLYFDYRYTNGIQAMKDYEEWEYYDGVYLATRIVQ